MTGYWIAATLYVLGAYLSLVFDGEVRSRLGVKPSLKQEMLTFFFCFFWPVPVIYGLTVSIVIFIAELGRKASGR